MGDSGTKLSGGQRQRLAIARSIIKQPKILILDEATSAMDVRAEQKVQMALDRASKNRTTISIAHRLSTIKKADNIIVLRKGKVVQQGTHDSLLSEEGGAYWTLATAQQLTTADHHKYRASESTVTLTETVIGEVDDVTSWEMITPQELPPRPGVAKGKRRALGAFGTLLREQTHYWGWYSVLLLGSLIGGGKPLSSSKPFEVHIFQLTIGNSERTHPGLSVRATYFPVFIHRRLLLA